MVQDRGRGRDLAQPFTQKGKLPAGWARRFGVPHAQIPIRVIGATLLNLFLPLCMPQPHLFFLSHLLQHYIKPTF